MTDLDALLRDTFADRADDAPGGDGLLAAVHRQARAGAGRRRLVRLTVAAAAAVVAALVVAVAVASRPGGGSLDVATGAPTTTPTGVDTSGWKDVGWRGVHLRVPASWPLDAQTCGVPQEDTVLTRQDATFCLPGRRPTGLTVVRFLRYDAVHPDGVSASATPAGVVGGEPVRRASLPLNSEPSTVAVLVVVRAGVTVTVQSPDDRLAAAVLATLTYRPDEVGELGGHLREVGGPAGTPARPLSGTVTVTSQDGSVTTVAAAADGGYAARLDPGTYSVSATSPAYDSGAATCQGPTAVHVTAGAATAADVVCQVK